MKILNFINNSKLDKLVSGNIADVVSKDGEWAISLKDEELSKLGSIIHENNLENEVKARFSEEDNFDLEVNKVSKYIFLVYLSTIWESNRSFEYAKNTLMVIEPFELEVGKSILEFNEEEIIKTITGLGGINNFYGLKFKIKVMKEYYDFYAKELGLDTKDNEWSKYYTTRTLAELIDVDKKQVHLKRENLIDLFDNLMNVQQGIIPLLLFEGINLSRRDDQDDIRHLKIENVKLDSVILESTTEEKDARGFNLSVDRVLKLDSEVMIRLVKAFSSNSITRINRHSLEIHKLHDTPYVLRGIIGRKKKSIDNKTMSYGGIYERLLECKRQYELTNVELDEFSVKYITNCGKSYYIYRYMEEGMTETEAIIETLKRFGEWNTNGNTQEERKLDTNKIRIARLRRSYVLYY